MANRKERRAAGKGGVRDDGRLAMAPAAGNKPSVADAMFASALDHQRAGRESEAADVLRQILAIAPNHADALEHLGIRAHRIGDASLAKRYFVRLVKTDPSRATGHYNLGLVLRSLRENDEAAASFRCAIAVKCDFAEAHLALALVLQEQGDLDAAASALEQALSVRPNYAAAYMNFGNLRREQGRLREASALGRRAVDLDPTSAVAFRNLAVTLAKQGLLELALACFDRALALAPDFSIAQSERLFYLNYHGGLSASAISAQHRQWGEAATDHAPAKAYGNEAVRHRRIRIGYVSADLHRHPVGYFLIGPLEAHDRSAFEVFCYSSGPRVDDMTRKLRDATDHWRDIGEQPDPLAEETIRKDRIDILVDLSGHTANNRLRLFARRPAAVQATWLGYVATTGLPDIDYVVTDAATLPFGSEALFSETPVRLPHGRFCYRAPDDAPQPAGPPSFEGRPFTFGSFNDIVKIGPDVVHLWSKILHAVPSSRLLLKWPAFDDDSVCVRFSDAFVSEGIGNDRLILRGYSPHADVLDQYGDVDVALDPFPFCGGLTTCEALWMGVPVITLPSERPASRQSLSFLEGLGLTELIARSDADYVSIAQAFAREPARLAALRSSLRPLMARSPICDSKAFTLALEKAFRFMWHRWCARQSN